VVLVQITVVPTTTETGIEVETNNMIEDMVEVPLRLHHKEEEGHIETEIAKDTDRQPAIVEAEAGAEDLAKNDHDDLPRHQTRRS
jgi:hypothetical protein